MPSDDRLKAHPTPGATPSAEARRIVMIDDSDHILDQSRAVLTAAGYDVVTTAQPVGASRHLGSADLIIVDLHMPGFDGKDVIESMRKSMRAAKRTCLIYLYTSDEEAALEHKAMGFDGCLTDKGNARALLDQVNAIFRLLRMRGIAGRIKSALDT